MCKLKLYSAYIITMIILLSLGSWQLYRLQWKNSVIDKLETRLQDESLELTDINNIDINDYEYRKVRLKGKFINQQEFHLYAGSRVYKGATGYFILTPFETTGNEYIIVNRGWVPKEVKDPKNRPETISEDIVEIEGYLLRGEEKTRFAPKNDSDKNLWLWIDLGEMKKISNLNIVNFFLLAKEDPDASKLPIGKDLTVNIRNDHLGYAITWYILAIILTVIFQLYKKQNKIL